MKFLISLSCLSISFSSGIKIITWAALACFIQFVWTHPHWHTQDRNLQMFALHLPSHCYMLLWLKSCMSVPQTSTAVHFILLYSTLLQAALLASVGGHPGLVSLLSDWQTDKPSCLGLVGCRWTQIAGLWWMTADRGLTATGPTDQADSRASPPPAQHYGGHCRSFCEQASPSVGEVWSNKSADGCGRCLEVINRSAVWVCVHSKTGAVNLSINWKDKDSCQNVGRTLLAMSAHPSHMHTNKKPLW